MTLIVTVSENTLWHSIYTASAGRIVNTFDKVDSEKGAQIVRKPIDIAELGNILDSHEKIVVCYSPAEFMILDYVENDMEPEVAAQKWLRHALSLISLFRLNRSKVKLVNMLDLVNMDSCAGSELSSLGWRLNLNSYSQNYTLKHAAISYAIEMASDLKRASALLKASTLKLNSSPLSIDVSKLITDSELELQTLQKKDEEFNSHLDALSKKFNIACHKFDHCEQTEAPNKIKLRAIEAQFEILETENKTLLDRIKKVELNRDDELAVKDKIIDEFHKLQIKFELQVEFSNVLSDKLHSVQEELEGAVQKERKYLGEHSSYTEDCGLLPNLESNKLFSNMSLSSERKNSGKPTQFSRSNLLARNVKPIIKRLRDKKKLVADKALLKKNKLFDEDWYLKTYKDVREAKLNAMEHYLLYGANEGRNPSIYFNTTWYEKTYRDVKKSGINPLIHFIKFGMNENRKPLPKSLLEKKV
jgi:hypothetical protein